MQRLEVSGAVRPLYGSLGIKGLNVRTCMQTGYEGRFVAEIFTDVLAL